MPLAVRRWLQRRSNSTLATILDGRTDAEDAVKTTLIVVPSHLASNWYALTLVVLVDCLNLIVNIG